MTPSLDSLFIYGFRLNPDLLYLVLMFFKGFFVLFSHFTSLVWQGILFVFILFLNSMILTGLSNLFLARMTVEP